MLDPKEQAKGGFRAHAEREQERRDKLAAGREADAAAGNTENTQGTTGSQADGERSPYAPSEDGERQPYAPPAGRQPKRWR